MYIIALSTIALSVILSQILVRKYLNDQQSDSSIINVAGRQRMLSQKLTKEIVLLTTENNEDTRLIIKKSIKKTLKIWELSHNALQKGNDSLGLPGKNSAEIKVKSFFFKANLPLIKKQKDAVAFRTKVAAWLFRIKQYLLLAPHSYCY